MGKSAHMGAWDAYVSRKFIDEFFKEKVVHHGSGNI